MNTIDHIAGQTWHGRKGAVENAFRYSIDYVMANAEAELRTPLDLWAQPLRSWIALGQRPRWRAA